MKNKNLFEQKVVNLVFFESKDCKLWSPVKPCDVPLWIKKDSSIIKRLVDGEAVKSTEDESAEDGGIWYGAMRSSEEPSVLIPGAKQC